MAPTTKTTVVEGAPGAPGTTTAHARQDRSSLLRSPQTRSRRTVAAAAAFGTAALTAGAVAIFSLVPRASAPAPGCQGASSCIKESIDACVPLWADRRYAACADLYASTARRFASGEPKLAVALSAAAGAPDDGSSGSKAWILRRAFDGVLHAPGATAAPGAAAAPSGPAALTAVSTNVPPPPNATHVLASFGGAPATTRTWRDMNDPVMGGASHSTFALDAAVGLGTFSGRCAIVRFLHAPGFCKIETSGGAFAFAAGGAYLGGALHLTLRSSTPSYAGFKVAFTASGMGSGGIFGALLSGRHSAPSFKADVRLPAAAASGLVTVRVPFAAFSSDWSEYTGNCDTRDPSGTQHSCCSTRTPSVCPTAEHLRTIDGLQVWAEGVEGNFHLELREIALGPA